MLREQPGDPRYPDNQPGGSRHISYMDGIRGLAAFYILAGHVTEEIMTRPGAAGLPKWLKIFCNSFTASHYLVAVFIVLSGYVLMMPVAQSADGRLRGGAWSYLQRRFFRIVPAYYAALAMSALLIISLPNLSAGLGTAWDRSLPALTARSVTTHLLLIHNLSWDTVYAWDGPAWTVATEWQIYFLLPLVFLPVFRRWGIAAVVAAGIVMGYAPHWLLHARYEQACPHFITLFTFGMAAAVLNHSPKLRSNEVVNRLPWPLFSAICFGAIAMVGGLRPDWVIHHYYWLDLIAGLGAFCFMIWATRRHQTADRPIPFVLRILSSPPALWLGAISYSLYLIHFPIVGAVDAVLLTRHVGALPAAMALLSLLAVVPPTAYMFHTVFERPFLSNKLIAQMAPMRLQADVAGG